MTSVRYCPHCGESISVEDKFCAHCGKKINLSDPSAEAASATTSTVVCSTCGRVNTSSVQLCVGCGSELTAVPEVVLSSKEPARQSKKKSKKNGAKLSLANYVVVLFFILIAIIVGVEYVNTPAPVKQPQVSNSAQEQTHTTDPAVLNTIKNLEEQVKANPKESETLLQLANALHDAKFYPRAIETYKSFLQLKPNHADARVDMAICYFETGDASRAIQEIESVVKKAPKHQMALFNLGVIHLSSGNMDEAKKWLQKATDIDPSSSAGQRAQELLHQH